MNLMTKKPSFLIRDILGIDPQQNGSMPVTSTSTRLPLPCMPYPTHPALSCYGPLGHMTPQAAYCLTRGKSKKNNNVGEAHSFFNLYISKFMNYKSVTNFITMACTLKIYLNRIRNTHSIHSYNKMNNFDIDMHVKACVV